MPNKLDQAMMRDLAYANLGEIEAGKLALSKSQNEQVKSFAQKMIDDHTKAQQDLQQLAQAKGVALPTTPDSKHQAMAKKFNGLSAAEFDRQYMAQGGLTDHKNTHRLLQRIQSQAGDADLKQLAATILPVVEQHLDMAQQPPSGKAAGDKASGSSSTGSSGSSTETMPSGAASAPSGTSGTGTGTGSGSTK